MSDPCFVCSHNYFCSTHPNNFTHSNPPPLNLPSRATGIFEPRVDGAVPTTSLMNVAMSTLNVTTMVSSGRNGEVTCPSDLPEPPQPSGPSACLNKRKARSGGSGAPIKHIRLNEAKEPTLASRRKAAEARLANLIETIDAGSTPPSTLTATDVSRPTPVRLRSAACDVWYFVNGYHSACPPDSGHERAELVTSDIAYQAGRSFFSYRRPSQDLPYLRCIPCLENGDWHVWSNRESGVTGAPRDHLWRYHRDKYLAKCRAEGYRTKYEDAMPSTLDNDAPQPAFTREGLVERIAKWVAVADQAMNVSDQPEFREMLLFCGQGRIVEKDIPHRDKIASEVQQLYLRSKAAIIAEMQAAQGRISLTSDLWTDDRLRSFIAVTAHYIDSQSELAEHLIAFWKIEGHHTGAIIGQAMFNVLEEMRIIGQITLDNATNNDTLMVELKRVFASRGLDFDPEENRIRCFPHVINLAVQGYLEALPEAAQQYLAELTAQGETPTPEVSEYLDALDSQPVNACRKTVTACRSSGIRREGIKRTVIEATFGLSYSMVLDVADDSAVPAPIPCALYTPIPHYLQTTLLTIPAPSTQPIVDYSLRNPDAAIPCVTHKQFKVLQDISSVLSVAQRVQQILSTERTPTLPLTLPLYEHLIEIWKSCRSTFPEQRFAVDVAISKLEEYVEKSRHSPIHALAMFVNPYIKLSWIKEHWSAKESEEALEIIKARLLRYAQEQHRELVQTSRMDAANRAARLQQRGYAHFLAFGADLRRASDPVRLTAGIATGSAPLSRTQSLPTLPSASSTVASSSIPVLDSPQAVAAYAAAHLTPDQLLAQQKAAIDCEVAAYLAIGPLPYIHKGTGTECANIVRNWKESQFFFPMIHKMAVDILPAQASSVSSERVFSSSKLTVTRDRNRISTELVESLQVLKHSIRRQRTGQPVSRTLDFMGSVSGFGDEGTE